MSLPLLSVPTYEVKLVSLPKPISYRPYLVKEEKILLMAQASDDPEDMDRAVKQIITACTNGAVDVDTLASFDLEYLFILLRSKSVNNVVEVHYECKAPREGTPDGLCHVMVPISVNLDEVKVAVPEGHTNKIMLTSDIGVTLRYPTAKQYDILANGGDIVPLIVDCLETVFTTTGEVTEIKEQTPDDVLGFVESLSIPQVDKIRTFFNTLPTLTHTIQFKCPKCGYSEDITLSGLADFFD